MATERLHPTVPSVAEDIASMKTRGAAPIAVANACGALAARTLGARLYLSWAGVDAMVGVE